MKQPKGRGQHVLYLDFDGVLHHEDVWRHPRRGLYFGLKGVGHTLFENAPLLEHLLAPCPDVLIVLSTSWVPSLRYSRAASKLPPGLKARVVGATFHTRIRVLPEFAKASDAQIGPGIELNRTGFRRGFLV